MICTVCEQPALVCHGPQLPCVLTWVVFAPRASFTPTLCSGSSLHCTDASLPEDVRSSWNIQIRSFKIYGIWLRTDIHTNSANAVTLVWGSLRLAPIMSLLAFFGLQFTPCNQTLCKGSSNSCIASPSSSSPYRVRRHTRWQAPNEVKTLNSLK